MTTASGIDWLKEFGISDWKSPSFFASRDDIDAAGRAVPQAHALRRAFEGMRLNGILCLQTAPVVYFKEVSHIDAEEGRTLHRRFWNQGLAPILVVISPKDVHVYSGLVTPPRTDEDLDTDGRLVAKLDRLVDAVQIRNMILALESGEFFRTHARCFDPKRRVDRELLRNLQATRERLAEVKSSKVDPRMLDALLCRVVFTCYLFDRKIIIPSYLQALGIQNAAGLRDILSRPATVAKELLYRLFARLGEDFNGDLFSDDLEEESRHITAKHLEILTRFLSGADVRSGQGSFWPYDFSIIPIETISAIYEHFLKSADPEEKKQTGAFYTPRFLAEIILDMALADGGSLLDKRFLDPACGSGIFLVGLFNRLAEEWRQKNPAARYDKQASGLMDILRNNLFGVDRNPTACRIASFSLSLALLDQLRPSDIQELQRKKKFLPGLIFSRDRPGGRGTIFCGDFFKEEGEVPRDAFHLVVGNPPWASATGQVTTAEQWCAGESLKPANRQLALAFILKAPSHLLPSGRVVFVLPHGVLFNHQAKAVAFQREWLSRHAFEQVLNLADYQRFLFEAAESPALVVRYRKEPPEGGRTRIEYLTPKTDWSVSLAEMIIINPEDRTEIELREVFADIRKKRVPLVWKERFWGTPRDAKLLDRLSLLPPLSEHARQPKEKGQKRWTVAQGFVPEQPGRKTANSKPNPWSSAHLFLEARSPAINLFVLESDCPPIGSRFPWLYRLTEASEIFDAPHVLVTKGLRVAYADFDVIFRHAVQGIHGPHEDRDLLTFLAAYLQSPLARYFLFHTSGRWGIEHSEVHLAELLRVPFPLPEQTAQPERSDQIVKAAAARIRQAIRQADRALADREGIVRQARQELEPLIYEYFDLADVEKILIEDTNQIVIKSIRPSHASERIPTLKQSSAGFREQYKSLLCDTLNGWARGGPYRVLGQVTASEEAGVGLVLLEKVNGQVSSPQPRGSADVELIPTLERLRKTFARELGSVQMLRGLKVFDHHRLYIIKPLSQRYWARTAALNDADEIAADILAHPARETV